VSDEQLRNPDYVRAVRVIGNGSPAMRAQLTAELAPIAAELGQRGKQNWLSDFIAARGGQTKVARYLPVEDQKDIPSQQDREAMQENASIKIGSPVLVIENDNHQVHLRRHFEAGFGALQAVQQGGDPHEAASFIQGILPHIGEHIQNIGNKALQKNAIKTAKELEKGLNELMSAIQQATPDPQAQQQVMSDIQLKQADTAAKIQDRNLKTQAALQDKEIKSRHSMALAEAEATQRMSIEDMQSAHKIMRESRNGEPKE
jgi:hypothetical protein